MAWLRPFVIPLTGIPNTVAPVGRIRYDSVADKVYRSLGSGLWKSYDLATAIFVKFASGIVTLGGSAVTSTEEA